MLRPASRLLPTRASATVERPHAFQRRQADMAGGRGHARPAPGAPSAQRRSMRMMCAGGLVLADLPVDVVVVLEQQERAGHTQGIERALRKL